MHMTEGLCVACIQSLLRHFIVCHLDCWILWLMHLQSKQTSVKLRIRSGQHWQKHLLSNWPGIGVRDVHDVLRDISWRLARTVAVHTRCEVWTARAILNYCHCYQNSKLFKFPCYNNICLQCLCQSRFLTLRWLTLWVGMYRSWLSHSREPVHSWQWDATALS